MANSNSQHQGCRHAHHHHRRSADRRRLALTLALAGSYMVAELIGGWLTNSLALLADAGHMFSDVAALALSLFAVWVAARPSPPQRTYGYYRAEILAALVNGAALLAISVYIFVEAVQRLAHPPAVQGPWMTAIAIGGLAVNLAGLWILGPGKAQSLNLRGAWLHVLTDALGSIAALAAGGLIWAFAWQWADPIASLVVGLLVIYSAWRLMAESVSVLMESAPRGIDVDEVLAEMSRLPGVREVHDLHIWTITSGLESLSAHVVMEDGRRPAQLLSDLRSMLHDRFGIGHITIQIEPENFEERASPFSG
jgi:cobalt-zinc-cadmium efflux system protein